jgi:acetylornithine deacetylase/succinyl-diaminopimelate desuccinylase-like protein
MIDWDAIAREAADLLSGYLRIRSVNPPGDESEAAACLADALRARGLAPELYESAPNRVNLLARLRGDGSRRPVLLYNHMDVVEADGTEWSDDPFSGAVKADFVWGRGAIDMKGMAVMQVLAMDLLKRHHPQRTRDIIFFAAADEEKGGALGTEWMIEHHWSKIESEYIWDEGGFGMRDFFGPRPVFTVAVAEKQDLWLRVSARGTPGHSGMPHGDNAAETLVRALSRAMKINAKFVLHPIVRRMFSGIARTMAFPKSLLLAHLGNPLAFRLARTALAADPMLSAMLRDTLSVTVLSSGGKENVIPDKAEAVIDARLLPGHDPETFIALLTKLIDDGRVSIEAIQSPHPSKPSDSASDFYTSLSATLFRLVPDSVTVPMLTPGTTDSCHFRRKGAQCYGLFPAVISPGELARFHGIDERISIENLGLGARIIYETLASLVG